MAARPATTVAHPEEHRLLGLLPGATEQEVRAAYRRRARALHPDRVHHLGPEAVAVATVHFRELTRAQQVLLASATSGPTATVVDGLYRPRQQDAARAYTASATVGVTVDAAA